MTFQGQWEDKDNNLITVKQNGATITSVKYNNNRPAFNGKQVDGLGYPVICVDFHDFSHPRGGLLPGVLNDKGNTIYWSNEGVWTKKS